MTTNCLQTLSPTVRWTLSGPLDSFFVVPRFGFCYYYDEAALNPTRSNSRLPSTLAHVVAHDNLRSLLSSQTTHTLFLFGCCWGLCIETMTTTVVLWLFCSDALYDDAADASQQLLVITIVGRFLVKINNNCWLWWRMRKAAPMVSKRRSQALL